MHVEIREVGREEEEGGESVSVRAGDDSRDRKRGESEAKHQGNSHAHLAEFSKGLKNAQNHLFVFQFSVVQNKIQGKAQVVTQYRDIRRGDLLNEIRKAARRDTPTANVVDDGVSKSESTAASPTTPLRGRSLSRESFRRSGRRRGSTRRATVSWGIQPIQPRDMRRIDPAFSSSVDAAILVRRSAIVLSMGQIAAVILWDRCYIIVPRGADSILSVIMDRLRDAEFTRSKSVSDRTTNDGRQDLGSNDEKMSFTTTSSKKHESSTATAAKDRNIRNEAKKYAEEYSSADSVPFEFVALEAMLAAMRDTVTKKLSALETKSRKACAKVRHDVFANGREELFLASEELHEVELHVSAVAKSIAEVLDSDDDMACMYLTKLFDNPSAFDVSDFSMYHEEAELLLESYLQDVRGIGAKAERLRFEITSTEKLVNLELDAVRNRLLQVDLAIETMTMTLGFGAMVAGLYGMNLKSGYENSDNWFWTIFAIVFGTVLFVPPGLFCLFRFLGLSSRGSSKRIGC
eukprot:g1772.t1